MPEHQIGTREEWQAARDELAKLEAEQAPRTNLEKVLPALTGRARDPTNAALRACTLVSVLSQVDQSSTPRRGEERALHP
jgi:hypothetical protein